ncbi:MAG: acyl carrier protein [Candidatus Omnitrophota bacterium]|nr:acyl carrier protein [Candidatus Omnitrophota bacterium]
MSDVAEKVRSIIAEQLQIRGEKVTEESRIMDDLGADSLDIVELFVILEEDFDIKIPDEGSEKIVTVGDAIKYIENELASK